VTIKSIEASFARQSGQRESLKDERAFEEPESASGKARGGGGWGPNVTLIRFDLFGIALLARAVEEPYGVGDLII
jgi:hypothetical protein